MIILSRLDRPPDGSKFGLSFCNELRHANKHRIIVDGLVKIVGPVEVAQCSSEVLGREVHELIFMSVRDCKNFSESSFSSCLSDFALFYSTAFNLSDRSIAL